MIDLNYLLNIVELFIISIPLFLLIILLIYLATKSSLIKKLLTATVITGLSLSFITSMGGTYAVEALNIISNIWEIVINYVILLINTYLAYADAVNIILIFVLISLFVLKSGELVSVLME